MDWSKIRASGVGSKNKKAYRNFKPIQISGAPGGLNVDVPGRHLDIYESAELTNFDILKDGSLSTRRSVITHNPSDFDGSPIDAVYCSIGGTFYEIILDDTGKIYYITPGAFNTDSDGKRVISGSTGRYTRASSSQGTIGTISGAKRLLPYKDVCLVLDGSYLKIITSISVFDIAYDDGSGTNAYSYMWSNVNEEHFTGEGYGSWYLGDNYPSAGDHSRAGFIFTTINWAAASYTIPPTTIYAKIYRVGNGYVGTDDQDIMMRIRRADTDAVIAEKVFIEAPIASNVSTTSTVYSNTFLPADITAELIPNTEYRISLEYANGDSSNYISIPTTYTSGADGTYTHYLSSAWAELTTDFPIMALKPGLPPKASFGVIHNKRPFLGGDPDNPGYVWFGNLTHLDWSTPDGGGYIGVVDANNSNYEPGALVTIYNELYVIGKEKQPYLGKLTGTSPSEYSMPDIAQKVWSSDKLCVATTNDIWIVNRDSIVNLRGVQEFGDIRLAPYANPIQPILDRYWNLEDAILEYIADRNQLWLVLPAYHRILVCHLDSPIRVKKELRYPWSEMEFPEGSVASPVGGTYWTESSAQSGEYYYDQIFVPGYNPRTREPDCIVADGVKLVNGTMGSLADLEWDHGDNDSLGHDAIYIRDDNQVLSNIQAVFRPTMVRYVNSRILIGLNDGTIQEVDKAGLKDRDDTVIKYSWRPPIFNPHIDSVLLERLEMKAGSRDDFDFDLSLYVNGDFHNSDLDLDYSVSADNRYEGGVTALTDPDGYLIQDWINFSAYIFQFRIYNITATNGYPIIFRDLIAYLTPLNV